MPWLLRLFAPRVAARLDLLDYYATTGELCKAWGEVGIDTTTYATSPDLVRMTVGTVYGLGREARVERWARKCAAQYGYEDASVTVEGGNDDALHVTLRLGRKSGGYDWSPEKTLARMYSVCQTSVDMVG